LVPVLLGALDVAIVCNRDSAFGRYCFPLKFYEAIACGTPLVAAAVGDVGRLLADRPECRYGPGNPEELALRVKQLFGTSKSSVELEVPTWCDRAGMLSGFLSDCVPVQIRC
jgi:glycosyltransferase involved in cell wall biosynthesis